MSQSNELKLNLESTFKIHLALKPSGLKCHSYDIHVFNIP